MEPFEVVFRGRRPKADADRAIGQDALDAHGGQRAASEGAIRLSLGPATTDNDVERFLNAWNKLSKSLGKERNGLAA